MLEAIAYQHGIYPRSEALVKATRDLDRGRTTDDAVGRLFRSERDEFVSLQRESGLDLLSDGLLRWQDIFRPIAESVEGVEARALVRWFDNNSFFRSPVIANGVRLRRPVPDVYETDGPLAGPGLATLPSPYLFSRAARSDGNRDALLRELGGGVLAPLAAALAGRGYRAIHLEEPWLGFFGIEDDSWDALEAALGEIRDAAGDTTLVFHTYFGDAAPHAERLGRLPVDAVGIDFVETDLDALGTGWEVGVLVGCLDGRRSVLESVEGTVEFVRRVAERLDPPRVIVSSNSELELLPREVAERKVRLLGEAAARVKEALA